MYKVQEELVKMLREGKDAQSIKSHFKQSYDQFIPDWKISATKKKLGLVRSRGPRPHRTLKNTSPDELVAAAETLETEIKAFCNCVRRVARREIISYVARIRKTRLAMHDTITDSEHSALKRELERVGLKMEDVDGIEVTEKE
jgi:hypothetical protein